MRAWAALAATLLAGCASSPLPPWPSSAPAPAPAPGATVPPALQPPGPPAPPPPPVAKEDEAFGGLRFGATRAEVQLAYPGAECGAEQCAGGFLFAGMPATFVVFAQPDGRWVASVAISDATAAARAWTQANAEIRGRWLSPNDGVEQGGSLLRWRIDRDGARQAVLRRCAPDAKCRGGVRTVVEVDFLAKGAPGQAW